MSNRQTFVLLIVAVVMVVVTGVIYSHKPTRGDAFESGAPLIQGLALEKIHEIIIKEGKQTATLIRQGDGFVVVERNNYLASTKKTNELLIEAMKIRTKSKVTESAENHLELGVTESSSDAVSVSFNNAQGQRLIGFIKGKSDKRGSAYVRLMEQDAVYAAADPFRISSTPISYINKELVEIDEKDIEKIDVAIGESRYSIVRDDQGTPALQDIPEGKRAKDQEVGGVFRALTNLSMSDVSLADKLELEWDATYACTLKEKLVYTVKLAKKDGKHYVHLSAKGPGIVKAIDPKKLESDEYKKRKAAAFEADDTAKKFTPRHASWVYEVSSWSAEKMRKALAELIEDIPAPEDESKENAKDS